MLRLFVLFIVAFFTLSSSKAKNIGDYRFCNDHKFTYFLLKVYDIYLCNNQSRNLNYQNLYSQDFALIIKYNISIKREKFAQSSIEEILRYYNLNKEEKKNYHKQLLNIFVDVKPEDEIAALYENSLGKTIFYHNRNKIGEINDRKFSKIFLDIWLHPKAHYLDMRNDLLSYTISTK